MSRSAALRPTTVPWRQRGCIAAVAGVLLLYVAPLAIDLPLLDPDEGLHAAIAREMVERGDFVTPRFLGEPFLDKPILFFWGKAASIWALGPTEVAVRLPGLFFGLLGALATGWLALCLVGRRAGALATLFYATMALPLALHQSAVHDVALVPFTTAALAAFWIAAFGSKREDAGDRADGRADATDAIPNQPDPPGPSSATTIGWSIVAGLALGLAVLTKGVVGVAVVGLAHAAALIAFWRVRPVVVAGGVLALVVAALIAAPWYLAMEAANPGYLQYFFVERHLLGFTTSTQIHAHRPWWYYLPIVVGGGFPWVAALPTALWIGWRSRRGLVNDSARVAARYAWLWLGTSLVFLSSAGSKLVTYVLPAMPAVAVMAAVAWSHALGRPHDAEPRAPWLAAMTMVVNILGLVLAPAAILLIIARYDIEFGALAWCAALVASAAWGVAVWNAHRGDRAVLLMSTVAAMVVTAFALLAAVMPPVARTMSARDLAEAINRRGTLPPTIWVVGERIGSVVFYLSPAIRADLAADRFVHVEINDVLRMPVPVAGSLIAVPDEAYAAVSRRLPLAELPFEATGVHRLYDAAAVHEAVVEQRRRF